MVDFGSVDGVFGPFGTILWSKFGSVEGKI
jgi:hypothetical protein